MRDFFFFFLKTTYTNSNNTYQQLSQLYNPEKIFGLSVGNVNKETIEPHFKLIVVT